MTRFAATAAAGLLAIVTLCQEAEKPEPALTPEEAERYAEARATSEQEQTIAELVGQFRAAYRELNTAAPPVVRTWQLHAGAPTERHGQEITTGEFLNIRRELDSFEAKVLLMRLFAANIGLRDRVRRLREQLALGNDWSGAEEDR